MRVFLIRLLTRRSPARPSPARPAPPAITDLDLLRALGCDE
ncbi:hypothetical protein [Deinococcus budaensis]|uniref:Uncharacterized protein n=1 Tax=Deinococcus budaensis TaxID=1665626 RepID=A0A7W8LQX1_9DEIO|nr:hypothetical protein [Deinococcus budaensis]MBB5235308.1 hypothetical protein [Deinococcus budaensis]